MNISSSSSQELATTYLSKETVSKASTATSKKQPSTTSVSSRAHNLNPTSFGIPHQEVGSVTNVTEVSKNESIEPNRLMDYVVETIEKLAVFLPECTEANSHQIFVIKEQDDGSESVELYENKGAHSETFNSLLETSQQAAKKKFFELLEKFYDPEAVAFLCPEKETDEPLTPTLTAAYQQRLVIFEKCVVDSCQGDLSKYPEQFQKTLEPYRKIQEIVASPPSPSTEQFAVIDSLSKYTGLPKTMLYAGLLTGGVLAASAVSGGAAVIPSLLHLATTSAIAHGSALSAALSSVTSHATAMTAAPITGGLVTHSAGATAAHHGTGAGAAAYRHAMHLNWVALRETLEQTAVTMGVGAALGGVIGGIAGGIIGGSVGIQNEERFYFQDGSVDIRQTEVPPGLPATLIGAVIGAGIGGGVGAVLGGLSIVFTNPHLVGGANGYSEGSLDIASILTMAGFFGGVGGSRQGTLSGVATGAATGIAGTAALISGSMVFGSICHLLAASLATGSSAVPSTALLPIARDTALALGSGSLTYSLTTNE